MSNKQNDIIAETEFENSQEYYTERVEVSLVSAVTDLIKLHGSKHTTRYLIGLLSPKVIGKELILFEMKGQNE